MLCRNKPFCVHVTSVLFLVRFDRTTGVTCSYSSCPFLGALQPVQELWSPISCSYFCRYCATKMRVFAIFSFILCLSMALGIPETLLKVASQHTEHSVHPRQTNCDVSQLVNYPSDCFEAVNAFSVSGMVPAVLCEPRCGQPVINFYLTCGLDFVVPTFVQNCGTNAMGQRCGTEVVQMAINRTSMEISSDCIGTIVFGSNCTTECRNTLTNARQSLGCCIQLLNTTAITPNFINPAIDPQLWEGSCGVDLPTACPSSLSPTNTDGGAALMISKIVLVVPVLLLGALVF